MKQIGDLDNRISRLEYYSVLQALETNAQQQSYANNVTGLQRFKTGIFADPFNDFTLSDTSDPEFRVAIDSSVGQLRPLFTENFKKFTKVDSQTFGVVTQGRLAMLSYDEEQIVANPLASNYRSPIESFYDFVGTATLFPNFDNAVSTSNAAPQNVTVDLASGFQNLLSSGAVNTHLDISTVAAQPVLTSSTSTTNYWSVTTTTTSADLTVNSQQNDTDLGNVITNVSLLPYMNQNIVGVIISGVRTNTRLYPFFDTIAISQYVAPARLGTDYIDSNGNLIYSNLNSLTSSLFIKNGNQGDPIISDQYGKAYFIFYLPPQTFRTGTKTLFVSNNPVYSAPSSSILTSAAGTYTASSLSTTSKDLSFTVLEPSFTTATSTSSTTSTYTTAVPKPIPQPNNGNNGNLNGHNLTGPDVQGIGTGNGNSTDSTVDSQQDVQDQQQVQASYDPQNPPMPPTQDNTTQEAGSVNAGDGSGQQGDDHETG